MRHARSASRTATYVQRSQSARRMRRAPVRSTMTRAPHLVHRMNFPSLFIAHTPASQVSSPPPAVHLFAPMRGPGVRGRALRASACARGALRGPCFPKGSTGLAPRMVGQGPHDARPRARSAPRASPVVKVERRVGPQAVAGGPSQGDPRRPRGGPEQYLDECPRMGASFSPGGGEHLPVILLLSNNLGAGGNYPRPTASAILLLLPRHIAATAPPYSCSRPAVELSLSHCARAALSGGPGERSGARSLWLRARTDRARRARDVPRSARRERGAQAEALPPLQHGPCPEGTGHARAALLAGGAPPLGGRTGGQPRGLGAGARPRGARTTRARRARGVPPRRAIRVPNGHEDCGRAARGAGGLLRGGAGRAGRLCRLPARPGGKLPPGEPRAGSPRRLRPPRGARRRAAPGGDPLRAGSPRRPWPPRGARAGGARPPRAREAGAWRRPRALWGGTRASPEPARAPGPRGGGAVPPSAREAEALRRPSALWGGPAQGRSPLGLRPRAGGGCAPGGAPRPAGAR
jgi:hypothetical protein